MPLNCIPRFANLFEFITFDKLEKIRIRWRIGAESAARGGVLRRTIMKRLNGWRSIAFQTKYLMNSYQIYERVIKICKNINKLLVL
jgi:hypothetical protein